MKQLWLLLVLTGLLALLFLHNVHACNEAICASLVSKCMLLKYCECDLSDKVNCTCCRDCQRCLSRLYTECCSCVGLCPLGHDGDVHKSSTVRQLTDPIPELFDVLTEEEDPEKRWTIYSYPAHLDLLNFKPMGKVSESDAEPHQGEGHRVRHGGHHAFIRPDTDYHNCTVAFMSQCISLNKCSQSCESMGAAGYRWFNEHGCCECIGSSCVGYGMGEPRCLDCPTEKDELMHDAPYGGHMYNYASDGNLEEEALEGGEQPEEAAGSSEEDDYVSTANVDRETVSKKKDGLYRPWHAS